MTSARAVTAAEIARIAQIVMNCLNFILIFAPFEFVGVSFLLQDSG
jgi:hypothetical protein